MSRGRQLGQKIGPYNTAGNVLGRNQAERRLRIEAGYTQDQLAEAAGVSVRTVRNIERWGEASTTHYQLVLAALGRRVSASWLDEPVRARAILLASQLASQTGKEAR